MFAMKDVNTVWLRVNGKVNIPDLYEEGDTLDCYARLEVRKKEISANDDGTVDVTLKCLWSPEGVYEFNKHE